MPEPPTSGWWRRMAGLPNDHPAKTLLVAACVALVCAAVVSSAAILLRPRQQAHREAERRRHILDLVARMPGVEVLFPPGERRDVEAHVIELATGHVVRSLDPATYDARKAALDPQRSIALRPDQDVAGIHRRALYATVYLVRHGGRVQLVILPVYGSGYEALLHGFVALEGDANTLVALTFYEHEETPGLGGQVDDPAWRSQWRGKQVCDEQGRVRIGVARGALAPDSPETRFQVDAISGATRTSEGVGNLLRFWLGDDGFGPYLAALRAQGGGG